MYCWIANWVSNYDIKNYPDDQNACTKRKPEGYEELKKLSYLKHQVKITKEED